MIVSTNACVCESMLVRLSSEGFLCLRVCPFVCCPATCRLSTHLDAIPRPVLEARLLLLNHIQNSVSRGYTGGCWVSYDAYRVVSMLISAACRQVARFARRVRLSLSVFYRTNRGFPLGDMIFFAEIIPPGGNPRYPGGFFFFNRPAPPEGKPRSHGTSPKKWGEGEIVSGGGDPG